jgi:hypothetical protein
LEQVEEEAEDQITKQEEHDEEERRRGKVELGLLRMPEPNNIISQINPEVDILYTYLIKLKTKADSYW